jgi:hypothetical protein
MLTFRFVSLSSLCDLLVRIKKEQERGRYVFETKRNIEIGFVSRLVVVAFKA